MKIDLKTVSNALRIRSVRWLKGVFVFVVLASWEASASDYLREVKPLLQERCYSCHGALKQKNGLRLDTVALALKGGKQGSAIEPGQPDQSLLVQRVATSDLDERMPPEHEGEPFTPAQVKILRDWIAAGAKAPADEKAEADPMEHWAFRQIARPPTPQVSRARWVRNPIDAFVAKQHSQHGLVPQPEASREVLLRRLYLDLIGLPPSSAEISAAMKDRSKDWYEKIVDRLLNDPRHGERWGRHWMDIWRYSDWWGLREQHRNSQKHMWHWRDWIIESINEDRPYDEMVRLMLAADELYPDDSDKLRATGFLARNWYLFNRNQWMEETVEHVSKGLLGLTMNCAKCHDHKYDPISQVDFYRMRAVFEPYHVRLDAVPGEPNLETNGIPRAFDGPSDVPTYRFIRGQESQPDKSAPILPGVPAIFTFSELKVEPVPLPITAWQPERRPWVIEDQLAAARKKVEPAAATANRQTEALAVALRKEADLLAPLKSQSGAATNATPTSANSRDAARNAVEAARTAHAVAEAAQALAEAEIISMERRAEAMRARWAKEDAANDDPALAQKEREATMSAVKAERAAQVAKARHSLAEIQQRLEKAAEDKKPPIEKNLKSARADLDKAVKLADAPVTLKDSYTLLEGAKWSATRFLDSRTDDPVAKFVPESSGRRTALAKWITDPRNPLTARVAANQIWMRHIGSPLVSSTFDFGRKGAQATHPELLDWLSAELMENGWRMKHLHRLIVTSATYRMSSTLAGSEANAKKDPDNIHLWRREPIRLESQAVRDSILYLAGTLDLAMGGPPVPAAKQEESKRRSVYFFHSNNERNLFLTTFDEATVNECYRRDQSIVPQQALALSNSRLVHDAAGAIAARLSEDEHSGSTKTDEKEFIRKAFAAVLGINASKSEIAASEKALAEWRQQLSEDSGKENTARTHFIWALINHNDFVTLR